MSFLGDAASNLKDAFVNSSTYHSYSSVSQTYLSAYSKLPQGASLILNLLSAVILVVGFAFCVFSSAKFLSKKNIFGINLSKYNVSDRPSASKIFATLFYIFEYLIFAPLIAIVWFYILVSFIFAVSNLDLQIILFVSAVLVMSIRVLSYINEKQSEEFSKIMFIGFVLFVLFDPNINGFISIIFDRVLQIPNLALDLIYYLILIAVLEFVLRLGYILITLIRGRESDLDSSDD